MLRICIPGFNLVQAHSPFGWILRMTGIMASVVSVCSLGRLSLAIEIPTEARLYGS